MALGVLHTFYRTIQPRHPFITVMALSYFKLLVVLKAGDISKWGCSLAS